MPALIETHSQNGIARLQKRGKDGDIGRCAGMGLDVGMIYEPNSFLARSIAKLLDDVHIFTAAVVTLAGVAFGVFVGQHRPLRFQDGAGNDVFRRDQFQLVVLPAFFFLNGRVNVGIGFGQGRITPQQEVIVRAVTGARMV